MIKTAQEKQIQKSVQSKRNKERAKIPKITTDVISQRHSSAATVTERMITVTSNENIHEQEIKIKIPPHLESKGMNSPTQVEHPDIHLNKSVKNEWATAYSLKHIRDTEN